MKLFALTTLLLSATLGASAHADKPAPAHSYQKPGAAIRLASPQQIKADPHSESQTTVTFSTPGSGTLVISAKPSANISVSDTGQHRFDLSREKPELTLTITTQDEGRHHIMFHASIEENGATMSRVFGIPVQVGNAKVQAKQENHPPFVIMEAEETIR